MQDISEYKHERIIGGAGADEGAILPPLHVLPKKIFLSLHCQRHFGKQKCSWCRTASSYVTWGVLHVNALTLR